MLTDERNARAVFRAERAAIARARAVDAASSPTRRPTKQGTAARRCSSSPSDERETLVLKPNDEYGGTGVMLGWETTPSEWTAALNAALADPPGTWVVQERIPVRREMFPQFDADGNVTMRDMLVDFAPYLFRGRMTGYLTRLSATGLANVTSGGGQVPVVRRSA